MAAAIIPILSSGKTKGAVSGSGYGTGYTTLNPSEPLVKQLGCIDLATCGCDGPDAAMNPACSPDALSKLPDQLALARNLIEQGLAVSEGQSKEEALASIDSSMAALNSAMSGESTGDLGDIAATDGLGNGRGTGKKGAGGSGGDGMGGGAYGGFGGGGAVKAGPADRSGLGSALSVNELNMIDEATGKKLTIWQRATRRYQGEGSRRALMMSRAEFIRKEAGLRVAQGEKLREEAERRAQARENSKKSQKKPASLGKKH
jgi:hypothetical protein